MAHRFLAASAAAGACLSMHAAAAQGFYGARPYAGGLLPNVGTDTRVGDLRPQLQRYFETTAASSITPAWIITPSLGMEVGVTDNALRSSRRREADVFTRFIPQIIVSGDRPRLQVNLNYSPLYTVYAGHGSQNRFDQFGNGQALATIVPDAVFLDVRGSIVRTSLTGAGLNQYSSTTYNRQDDAQTASFAVTPYAQHRFGGWGTGQIGYSYARTTQNAQDQPFAAAGQGAFGAFNTPGYGALGNLTTQRERASFTTGENLGRFNDLIFAEATQYNGSGSYANAHRNQVENEFGFALTRQVTLLAGVGYQDIRYSGLPDVRINEPTWNVGARYAPSPDTTLTLLYGRRDGISSFFFTGQVAPTARTRLIGRYTTGLTTDLEQAQNVLEVTSVGPTGLVTDTITGAPVGYGSTFGVQNGIYRARRLSVTALLLRDRDSFSLGVVSEERTTLTTLPTFLNGGAAPALIPPGTKSNSVYASASWQHDLAPDLNSLAFVQYGTTDNTSRLRSGSGGQQRTLAITAALNKRFTETLSGSVRYSFINQSGGNLSGLPAANANFVLGRGDYTENAVIVGLRKSF